MVVGDLCFYGSRGVRLSPIFTLPVQLMGSLSTT